MAIVVPKLGVWEPKEGTAGQLPEPPPAGAKPDGCALAVRREIFELSNYAAWYCQDGAGGPRSGHHAVLARLSHKHSGAVVGIATTYLKWSLRTRAPAETIGIRQMRELLAAWGEQFDLGMPGIICGDMNADPGSEIIEIPLRAGWVDTYATRPQDSTANSKGRVKRIDFLLHNRNLRGTPRPLPGLSVEIPMPSDGVASDHLPITGTYEITAA